MFTQACHQRRTKNITKKYHNSAPRCSIILLNNLTQYRNITNISRPKMSLAHICCPSRAIFATESCLLYIPPRHLQCSAYKQHARSTMLFLCYYSLVAPHINILLSMTLFQTSADNSNLPTSHLRYNRFLHCSQVAVSRPFFVCC